MLLSPEWHGDKTGRGISSEKLFLSAEFVAVFTCVKILFDKSMGSSLR